MKTSSFLRASGASKVGSRKAFSLIELMVAMGILTILMLMLTLLLDQVQKSWRFSESRVSQFREARVAFDAMAKNLSQASLNTYWELRDDDDPPDGIPDGYYRTSELQFLTMDADSLGSVGDQTLVGQSVFFQAPLGFSLEYRNLNNLFNGRGYFVAFGSDKEFRPKFVDNRERYRFRLMEFRPPAESNQVFADGQQELAKGQRQELTEWFKQGVAGVGEGSFEDHLNPLAENIIAIVLTPRDSLEEGSASRESTYSEIAPNFSYDTNDDAVDREKFSQQLPPLVRITMVAIDETAAVRLEDGASMPEKLRSVVENRFRSTEKYNDDVKEVTEALSNENISHKIFSSLVMLRASKWST